MAATECCPLPPPPQEQRSLFGYFTGFKRCNSHPLVEVKAALLRWMFDVHPKFRFSRYTCLLGGVIEVVDVIVLPRVYGNVETDIPPMASPTKIRERGASPGDFMARNPLKWNIASMGLSKDGDPPPRPAIIFLNASSTNSVFPVCLVCCHDKQILNFS